MYGSLAGNITGTLYFLIFQTAGFLFVRRILPKEHPVPQLILGSTAGSLLLQWIPLLFSFPLGFGRLSHALALLSLLPVFFFSFRKSSGNTIPKPGKPDFSEISAALIRHRNIMILSGITMVFWIFLLHTHTLQMASDGSMHCGQSTYGDMNMHLGFITSIAVQSKFPPDYSIFPGVKLAYPFLSDSISSSLYVLGASLRYAYILPMIAAFAQVMGAVYLFAHTVLGSRAKALLTWALYFFNGGLGFCYFMDWAREGGYSFSDIFTGFYTTPTNLIGNNIRWANIIADMLLPQRATLFGYAAAFPCIYLLYRAAFCKVSSGRHYFILAALFAGALPMVHTHSFLAVAIISASWLLLFLHRSTEKKSLFSLRLLTILFILFMSMVSFLLKKNVIREQDLMYLAAFVFALIFLYGVWLLILYCENNGVQKLLSSWGVYLACTLALALPQLIFWTFGQVAEGGFVRGHFNWGNQGDSYFWFYLKNIGVPAFFLLGALWAGKKKSAELFLPAGIIWFLAELVLFTPNSYDNNKLLYIAYFLMVCGIANYAVDLWNRFRELSDAGLLSALALFSCFFSGVLTLGREAVSDYQLYSPSAVKLAEYIEEETPADSVILTDTRHANEVSSLTGRSILCGSDSFLYFHGIDTSKRKEELRLMYEAPAENLSLFETYHISYVVLSSWERSSYAVDADWFAQNTALVFEEGDTRLYQMY